MLDLTANIHSQELANLHCRTVRQDGETRPTDQYRGNPCLSKESKQIHQLTVNGKTWALTEPEKHGLTQKIKINEQVLSVAFFESQQLTSRTSCKYQWEGSHRKKGKKTTMEAAI